MCVSASDGILYSVSGGDLNREAILRLFAYSHMEATCLVVI
jgi:hypothetical protein